MKDTIIKAGWKKRELWVLIACFVFAFLLNIYSIIRFKTEWSELLTSLHVTIILSIVIYFLTGIIRILIWGVSQLFKRKKLTD
jgi:F0F1-type ATP synthase membrane subunit a